MQKADLNSSLMSTVKAVLSLCAPLLMLTCTVLFAQSNAVSALCYETKPTERVGYDLLMVRIAHYESGKYVTVNPQTGEVTATSAVSDNTTKFTQTLGTNASFLFRSEALVNHYLALVPNNGSYKIAVVDSRTNKSLGGYSDTTIAYDNWVRVQSPTIRILDLLKIHIDGKDCYMAFEENGTQVEDPCNIADTDVRANIFIKTAN